MNDSTNTADETLGKGALNGVCNRTACDRSPAIWYNEVTERYYCVKCARKINGYNGPICSPAQPAPTGELAAAHIKDLRERLLRLELNGHVVDAVEIERHRKIRSLAMVLAQESAALATADTRTIAELKSQMAEQAATIASLQSRLTILTEKAKAVDAEARGIDEPEQGLWVPLKQMDDLRAVLGAITRPTK